MSITHKGRSRIYFISLLLPLRHRQQRLLMFALDGPVIDMVDNAFELFQLLPMVLIHGHWPFFLREVYLIIDLLAVKLTSFNFKVYFIVSGLCHIEIGILALFLNCFELFNY